MNTKLILLGACLMGGSFLMAQAPPSTGSGNSSSDFWSRSGNVQTTGGNIFGTRWNSPIYTWTGGTAASNYRMKLNSDHNNVSQYAINGYGWLQGVNTTGYLGLGANTAMGSGQYLWSNIGAYSLLHLNGRVGAFVQDLGYRPWMQTGVTFTDNQDLSYIGLRQVGTGFDATETVVLWSDNAGVDDFAIRFTGAGGDNTISTTNLTTADDLDGLHVARFTGGGNFGLGNTFGINPTGTPANLYVSPQSLAHYSLSNFRSVWQQFTNRNTTLNSGTGENATDGLRIGIVGNSNLNVNGTAAMYSQEDRALLFSTNANTNTMNVLTGNTQERMRIMSAGTPTHLASGAFGVYNPAGVASNLTRMSISHNPAQPITRPLSLLHLGYNTGLTSIPAGSTDGWRNWMDIGTFTTNGTDHIYMGLKQEGTDRLDAVLNWGDNQAGTPITNQGPDNLRFIFTSSTTSILLPGDPISQSTNGLETGRFFRVLILHSSTI